MGVRELLEAHREDVRLLHEDYNRESRHRRTELDRRLLEDLQVLGFNSIEEARVDVLFEQVRREGRHLRLVIINDIETEGFCFTELAQTIPTPDTLLIRDYSTPVVFLNGAPARELINVVAAKRRGLGLVRENLPIDHSSSDIVGDGAVGIAIYARDFFPTSIKQALMFFGRILQVTADNLGLTGTRVEVHRLMVEDRELSSGVAGLYNGSYGGTVFRLAFPTALAQKVLRHDTSSITSVEAEVGRRPDTSELVEALIVALGMIANVTVAEGGLTPEEHSLRSSLVLKYRNKNWAMDGRG